jgi:hypothetical protein
MYGVQLQVKRERSPFFKMFSATQNGHAITNNNGWEGIQGWVDPRDSLDVEKG